MTSIATLCKELYFSLKLFGGQASISRKEVTREAIFYGILALDPKLDKASVNLLSEPCVALALERAGDELVRRSLTTDPVYQRLTAYFRSGAALFTHIDNTKSPALELTFVWHVLRMVILHGGSVALSDVLGGFVGDSRLFFPPAVEDAIVTATRACTPGVLPLLGGGAAAAARQPCPDFALFTHDDADYVLFDVDTSAGANVILRTTHCRSTDRDLVLVHCEAENESRLVECLRATTLAWQYVEKPHRDALMTGTWEKSGGQRVSNTLTPKRSQFSELVASHPHLFQRPIRVVLTVGPYASHTVDKCQELNADTGPCCDSPVVLCSFDLAVEGLLPSDLLSFVLNAFGKTDSRLKHVVHPASDEWWLPYSVKSVDEAISSSGCLPLSP